MSMGGRGVRCGGSSRASRGLGFDNGGVWHGVGVFDCIALHWAMVFFLKYLPAGVRILHS